MKNVWLLGVILIMASCKTQSYPTANVVFQSVSHGVISMRSLGLGKNKQEAIDDAEKNAISTLLFRGLPKSGQEMPLLGIDEEACKKKHPDYLNTLLGISKRYKTFIVASIPVTSLQKQENGLKNIAADVRVNINSLRLDLEKQGLIRRFGY